MQGKFNKIPNLGQRHGPCGAVPKAVKALQGRGVVFVDHGAVQPSDKGALTLAGPLEAKLKAVREAGFTQIMLNATDIVGHPGGEAAAVKASGLRVTGFQVLRDFEGLSGTLHAYKVDIARAMLDMCRALGSNVLLACSSASHQSIRVAYEALSWGRHVNEFPQSWEIEAARHSRVFPGEGVHGDKLAEMVRQLDQMGYRGDYSFEVFNDDYQRQYREDYAKYGRLIRDLNIRAE